MKSQIMMHILWLYCFDPFELKKNKKKTFFEIRKLSENIICYVCKTHNYAVNTAPQNHNSNAPHYCFINNLLIKSKQNLYSLI